MKRFLPKAAALALATLCAAPAFADITVMTPKNLSSQEEVAAYVEKLEFAVRRECQHISGPVIGAAFYTYAACVKATRADVAKKDPTGLYAKAIESAPANLFAAK